MSVQLTLFPQTFASSNSAQEYIVDGLNFLFINIEFKWFIGP